LKQIIKKDKYEYIVGKIGNKQLATKRGVRIAAKELFKCNQIAAGKKKRFGNEVWFEEKCIVTRLWPLQQRMILPF